MSLTVLPGRLTVEADYVNVARQLLSGTGVEPTRIALEVPSPRELVMLLEARTPTLELVAARLLTEYWLYDWMPVMVRIQFVSAWSWRHRN